VRDRSAIEKRFDRERYMCKKELRMERLSIPCSGEILFEERLSRPIFARK
jgi:hypothetical protein